MDKCQVCKKRFARITFALSMLDWSHGSSTRMCRQCYIHKLEESLIDIKKNIKEQKRLLTERK